MFLINLSFWRTDHLITFTLVLLSVTESAEMNLERFGHMIQSLLINFEQTGDQLSVAAQRQCVTRSERKLHPVLPRDN